MCGLSQFGDRAEEGVHALALHEVRVDMVKSVLGKVNRAGDHEDGSGRVLLLPTLGDDVPIEIREVVVDDHQVEGYADVVDGALPGVHGDDFIASVYY